MDFGMIWLGEQTALAKQELRELKELSERFGHTLTEKQVETLITRRFEALQSTGRIELGTGVLKKLVFAFCDSPFIQREEYVETLCALQDDFYALKSDSEGLLSDDELIDCMKRVFDGRAQGSLDYMEGLSVGELCRAAQRGMDDDEPDDE